MVDTNLNYKLGLIYLLLLSVFFTKLIDFVIYPIHIVNLFIVLSVVAYFNVKSKISIIVILYFLMLNLSIGIGYLYDYDIETSVPHVPVIESYSSIIQPIVGVIYDIRFALLFAVFYLGRYRITINDYEKIITYLMFLLCINLVFIYIEYLYSPLAMYLKQITPYGESFSFVYRGLSMLLNVYDATFSMVILFALALYKYLMTKRYVWIVVLALSALSIVILGTRIGYVAIPVFVFIYMFMADKNKLNMAIKSTLFMFTFIFLLILISTVNDDVRMILKSFVTMEDDAGSMQLHKILVVETLKLILENPFGIGVGKTNFAAISNDIYFVPESFLLALFLDIGIVGGLLFVVFLVLIAYRFTKDNINYNVESSLIISSLLLTFLVISVINMQVFHSVFLCVVLGVLTGCGQKLCSKRRSECFSISR